MKTLRAALAFSLVLSGCASDQRLASQSDPYENLPLARPAPIAVYPPSKDYNNQNEPHFVYPPGDSYPENAP
jgi:hypothetical protein